MFLVLVEHCFFLVLFLSFINFTKTKLCYPHIIFYMHYKNFDRAALRELYIATSDSLANATTTLYTTPGSYLLLNISDLKDSISCEFYSDRTKSRKKIVKAYREYDTNKYEMVTSDNASLAIQAPKKQGHFSKTVQVFELGNSKLNVTGTKHFNNC